MKIVSAGRSRLVAGKSTSRAAASAGTPRSPWPQSFVNREASRLRVPPTEKPMRRLTILATLMLAACDSPAPQMIGAVETKVTRGGHDYAVYVRDGFVEVIRFGYARRAEQAAVREQMVALIPEVTGCIADPRSLQGDSGEMRARLRCPRGVRPKDGVKGM
jgi:hypothetical protein